MNNSEYIHKKELEREQKQEEGRKKVRLAKLLKRHNEETKTQKELEKEIEKFFENLACFSRFGEVYQILDKEKKPHKVVTLSKRLFSFLDSLRSKTFSGGSLLKSNPDIKKSRTVPDCYRRLKRDYFQKTEQVNRMKESLEDCTESDGVSYELFEEEIRKMRKITETLRETRNELVASLKSKCDIDYKSILHKLKTLKGASGDTEFRISAEDLLILLDVYSTSICAEYEERIAQSEKYFESQKARLREKAKKAWHEGQSWGAEVAYEDRGKRWK